MRAVQVTLILDCERDEVADAVNEILRPLQRSHGSDSCLVDYSFNDASVLVQNQANDYEEGDAFS